MLCKGQIELPRKSTRASAWRRGFKLRLDHKRVKLGCSVTGTRELPSHGALGLRIHVQVEPQMRHTAFGQMQVETKTCGADVAFHIETFEICHRRSDEILIDIGGTNTTSELSKRWIHYLINSLWMRGFFINFMNFSSS
jgi:hypothetical protein